MFLLWVDKIEVQTNENGEPISVTDGLAGIFNRYDEACAAGESFINKNISIMIEKVKIGELRK